MNHIVLNRIALGVASAVVFLVLAKPASAAIIADWRFARTASSVPPVTDGQAVTTWELYDEVVGGGAGAAHTGDTFESPKYATYNPAELAGFAGGGDGYALHTGDQGTTGLGYVYFSAMRTCRLATRLACGAGSRWGPAREVISSSIVVRTVGTFV